jgi:hypothetical protein
MKRSTTIRKNYRVEIPGKEPIIIRETTTVQHAIKHACYATELRISVRVVDNRTEVEVISLPAIDRDHAIKPKCKRDKRYARLGKKGKK